jgi:uncharacterized damage-inducible protein DinB
MGFGQDSRVVDRKPPRLAAGERETLVALLQYQRDSLCRKVQGLSDSDAQRTPVRSGISLLWLIRHMTAAESLWIMTRFRGKEQPAVDDGARFVDSLDDAVTAYRVTSTQVDNVVMASELDDPCRSDDDQTPVNLRWILTHLLEETARHAGHADILRELIDGQTGR